MRKAILAVVWLSILPGLAAAADQPPTPLTVEQAADAVLAAVKAKDDAALKAVAEKEKPDPWLVADELCFRGEHDAAEAFAKAAPRVDVETLPAYVEAWRRRAPDQAERELLAAMNAALQARTPLKVVEGTAALPVDPGTVIEVRLLHSRGTALRMMRRLGESAAVLRKAADTARALGWLGRAVVLYHESGLSAYQGSSWPDTLTAWGELLAMEGRRGNKAGLATTLGNIGVVHQALGDYAKALSTYERALEQQEALGDRAGAATTLGNIGTIHNVLGDYAKALSTHERALEQQEALGDKAGAARTLGNIGNVHEALGDYAKALSFHERALEQKEALGDEVGAARTLGSIGNVHSRLGDLAKVLASQERALEKQEALGDRAGAAGTRGNIGVAHYALGDYAKALSTLEHALEQLEALGDRAGAATTLGNIGLVHAGLGDYAKALSFHERALEQQEALGDKAGAARTLGNIGIVYDALGDHAKALSTYERALEQKEALGDRAGAASTLGNIGKVHNALGDYAKALSTYERALEQKEALGDKAGAAVMLGNIGVVHEGLGNLAKALSTYERALEQLEALGDKAMAAVTLGNIGNVLASLGDCAEALSTHERALEQQEALGDRPGAAITLGNIGTVHYALGDYAKALSFHERALAQKEALGDKAGAAVTLGNIGSVHYALGDYTKALSFHERALAQMEALGDRAEAAATLGNIGGVHHALGDYAKALSSFERALDQQEALGDKARAAATLVNVGNVHHALGDYAKALSTFERALEKQEALGDRAGAALSLGNIGGAYQGLGDYTQASRFLERSASAARSLRTTPILFLALERLARLHLDADNPSRALAHAREALLATESFLGGLGDEQGATAREQHASLFAVGTLAAAREEDAAGALTFLESGRAGALLDSLGQREVLRWKAEALPPGLREADRDAQAALDLARHAHDRAAKSGNLHDARRAAKALDTATEGVREVTGRIQRELKQQAGLFYPRAKTLHEIQGALEKDQALILYGLCLDEALALILRPDSAQIVNLGKSADVEAACEALDATDKGADPTKALAHLRSQLIAPLKLGQEVKQVLVSPEGPLCFLPFGALFDQTVTMTPSGTTHVFLLNEEHQGVQGILSLGNPDYAGTSEDAQAIYYRGRGLQPLPATKPEVEAIGTTSLLGAEASEAGLREAIKAQKRWKAVHFACHGLIDVERPMLSSLALSRTGDDDGFLTALEVLRMDIPADLAVLSACETGKGRVVKGEGIVGLTRAFMFAGAPRVICSLWKVDDEATKALMIKFYELWNPKEGQSLGAAMALKKAQEFVQSQEKWKHPYYWAAWVLWGLPD
jgi:tetratricopeptide (TPR) repeat protein